MIDFDFRMPSPIPRHLTTAKQAISRFVDRLSATPSAYRRYGTM